MARGSAKGRRREAMAIFAIDRSNKVLLASEPAEGDESVRFSSEVELASITSDWPLTRFAEVWNGLRGVAPVARFKDRKTAVRRIWTAIQESERIEVVEPDTPKSRGRPRSPVARKVSSGEGTKTEQVIALLKAPAGATLKALMAATGWQAHSVRGFISAQLVKRMGLRVTSIKRDGERVYLIRR